MSDDIKLPELPEPESLFLGTPSFGSIFKRHKDEAMHAYARAAVELNRVWLPIEGAPKDGTEVLAWRSDCGQFITSFTSPSAFPLTQDEIDSMDEETLFAEGWFTQWPQAIRLEGREIPTYYMPLPPDPSNVGSKCSEQLGKCAECAPKHGEV